MKKVVSILAVVLFAFGMIATQADKLDFDFDIETMLACGDCGTNETGDRGNTKGKA